MAALSIQHDTIFNFQSERDICAFSHYRTVLSVSVAKSCSFRCCEREKDRDNEYVWLATKVCLFHEIFSHEVSPFNF